MRKLFTLLFLLVLIKIQASATVWEIGVRNLEFVNSPDFVNVGDTMKWTWESGSHTTTSVVVPLGAATWDSPITQSNQTFIYVVTVAGAYSYICIPHSNIMNADFVALNSSSTPELTIDSNFHLKIADDVLHFRAQIPEVTPVKFQLYDLTGKLAFSIINRNHYQGVIEASTPLSSLSNGIYFAVLQTNAGRRASKITISR